MLCPEGEDKKEEINGKDEEHEPASKRQDVDEQPKEILEEGRIYFLYRSVTHFTLLVLMHKYYFEGLYLLIGPIVVLHVCRAWAQMLFQRSSSLNYQMSDASV